MPDPLLIGAIIALALLFDLGNGMNDAANSISTIVASRVLPFRTAVLMAGFFNLLGPFVFGLSVANTIGKGLVQASAINETIILAGLIGAILTVYVATFKGLPISASHALIGGFVGSAVASAGTGAIIASGVMKVLAFILIAPVVGMLGSLLFSVTITHLFRNTRPSKVSSHFRRLQILSAAAYSLSHGTNDAQKTMGIISILLFSAGYLGSEFYVPTWVVVLSAATICAGTLLGGRKVVETMGLRLISIRPVDGFAAETAGAGTIIASSILGVPVSTTHVICGSIVGVGISKRANKIRWPIARHIFWAWVFTIPAAAISGAIILAISKAAGF